MALNISESLRTSTQDDPVQASVTRCLDSFDMFVALAGEVEDPRGLFYAVTAQLDSLASRVGRYHENGNTLAERLTHDSALINGRVTMSRGGLPPHMVAVLTAINRHLVLSTQHEFEPAAVGPVALGPIIGQTAQIIDFLSPPNFNLQVYTSVAPDASAAASQEDDVWRVLYNAARNGQKGVERRQQRDPNYKGQIALQTQREGDDVIAVVRDSGVGFGELFDLIRFDPSDDVISLSEVLRHSRGVSGFRSAGIEGSGNGLVIMETLAERIGAEIQIGNPRLTDGGLVQVRMPAVE